MIWKWSRLIILLLLSGIVYFFCQVGVPFLKSPLPPFGKLLNPTTGFWKNTSAFDDNDPEINHELIEQTVDVLWDERRVPHIFAENNHDLYFTQGYIHAKERLWQMDFVTRVSSGRLSEVVGERAANFDQFHRRIGLGYSAKLTIDTMKSFSAEYAALEAYSDGVNAYIEKLKPADRPVEFKILNYKPEKWSPYKSALVLKYMAWDLDGSAKDKYMTNAKRVLPEEVFNAAYPLLRPYTNPVAPEVPRRRRRAAQQYNYQPTRTYSGGDFAPNPYQKGSNNWVVNGSKTRTGKPILANDPHLGLTLPAIWYENQLSSNDCSVYGVSLPGVPMVVIGFNTDVAWGLTYTQSDRIDFVKMDLNEEKNQYRLKGKWENPLILEDTIVVRGAANRINRTLITKFGPIVYTDSIPNEGYNNMIPDFNMAMNWTAIAPTLEFITMYRLNRAKNLSDYKAALPYFAAPGQNFVFASKDNDIAIWHNGKFPIREMEQARFVNEKAEESNLWDEYIPFDELPHSENPAQGFLVSANQQPHGENYPYYLGSDAYSDFERSNRIIEMINEVGTGITPQDFQNIQLDNKSMMAEKILPLLLEKLDETTLRDDEADVYAELNSWDFNYTAFSKSPGIFYAWLSELRKSIWQDEIKPEFAEDYFWLPFSDRTTELFLTDTLSVFFDDKTTPQVETYRDVIETSFKNAVEGFVEKHGGLNESWQWGKLNPTKIGALANMSGFGVNRELITGGSSDAVNAIDGDSGPSWRMIVSLDGETPTAFGIYPGGQSGNPGSEDYESSIDTWAKGGYYPLHLISDKNNPGIQVEKTIFKPEE